jgi:ferredoxin
MQLCPREEWTVCLLFEHASEKDRRRAKPISTDEAVRIVRATTERGDIHQVFYFQDGERPFELCNCCTCCCFPLREAKEKDNEFKEQLRTGYVATTDAERCTGCGLCLDSCFFEARYLDDERGALHLVDALCFGCARCIPACPEDAIRLEYHPGRGIPVPGFQS